MCGIVGAVARRDVVPVLLEGLRRLEYRGYDSAGIALADGKLQRLRSTGRVADLEAKVKMHGLSGHLGIAHTRWATHGAPSERNAHPHVSRGTIAVVHNGIVENHEILRKRLARAGYRFNSDTDTEVIAHLIHSHYDGDLLKATQKAVAELSGAYAIAVLSALEAERLVCARKGSPLLLGIGEGENFFASDASALLPVTRKMVYLEEGDVADAGLDHWAVYGVNGRKARRAVRVSELAPETADLGGFRHFMQKEIHEQPRALGDTLEAITLGNLLAPEIFGARAKPVFQAIDAVTILACGTSYHAGLVARYWIESLAGLPCNVEVASEYRYRDSVPNAKALIVTVSQSGETADTLAALAHAGKLGHRHSLAICNVPESALTRQSQLRFMTRAGPEIGVASTKSFTTQLAVLFVFAVILGRLRGKISKNEKSYVEALRRLPGLVQEVLQLEPQVAQWAERFADKQHALFLGRGMHYPIAMEGALKLKEISYIHAEAYPAGELKHGPLALVDADMPVIAIAPNDALLEKLKSNLQEVRARGGELYVFADQEVHFRDSSLAHVIKLPGQGGLLSPILHTVPLQLLAYHAALKKGTDVDKPRNLAKSVTVE